MGWRRRGKRGNNGEEVVQIMLLILSLSSSSLRSPVDAARWLCQRPFHAPLASDRRSYRYLWSERHFYFFPFCVCVGGYFDWGVCLWVCMYGFLCVCLFAWLFVCEYMSTLVYSNDCSCIFVRLYIPV